jgi:hypothetical protein
MPNKLTFEYIREIINKENLLLSSVYINNKSLLEIKCNNCKKLYCQNFDRYKRGYRHQQCSNNLNSILALKKRYNTNVFIKDTIIICEWCKKKYNPKRNTQKFCNIKCSVSHLLSDKEKLKINGIKGGVASASSQQRRSKNEILFSELCIEYFGENDIQCNEQIFKDTNGNFWDCDIYIKSLKIAILWDGWYWHYSLNVSKKQKTRDILKRKIILDNSSTYYTIIDKGKYNKQFVQYQFDLFIHKLHFKKVLVCI